MRELTKVSLSIETMRNGQHFYQAALKSRKARELCGALLAGALTNADCGRKELVG
jgi:hypothetical protein